MPGDLTDPDFYQRWLTADESLSAEVPSVSGDPDDVAVALADAFAAIEACGTRVEAVRANKGYTRVISDLAEKASGQRRRLWDAVILHAPDFNGIVVRGKVRGRWIREVSIVRPARPAQTWTAPDAERVVVPAEPGPVNATRFRRIELPDED